LTWHFARPPRIERARFTRPVALAVAFDAIEGHLGGIGRPPTALCACELRSPAQFTDAGFVAFNRHYGERLAAWGIFRDPPATPSFYAFSYTVPSEDRAAISRLRRCARKRASCSGRWSSAWRRSASAGRT
jgi:hypothetical protein